MRMIPTPPSFGLTGRRGQALPPLTRHLLAEPKAEHAQRVSRVEALETQLKHRRQLSGM